MEEKKYELMISQYVDNELNKNDIGELKEHLAGCKECQKLMEEYNEMKNSVNNFYSSLDIYSFPATIRHNKKINFIQFAIAASIVFITVITFKLVMPVKNNSAKLKPRGYTTEEYFNNRSWLGQISNMERRIQKLQNEIQTNSF